MASAVVFDYMGVLFKPGSILRHGFFRFVEQSLHERLREAYNKAVLGNPFDLNKLLTHKEQISILDKVVKPAVDLSYLKSKLKGRKCYCLTNLPSLWAYHLFEKHLMFFDHVFVSACLRMKKPDIKLYEYVSSCIGYDVLFFDDKEKNVNAAKEVGWNAVKVDDPQRIFEFL